MVLPAEKAPPYRRNDNTVHPVDVEAPPPPAQRGAAKWFPWLVPAIVLANTVMFIYSMYVNNCPENTGRCVAGFLARFSFQPLKENALFGPSSVTLLKVGALDVDKVINGHQGWRLITSMWLHAGILHILSNMIGLIIIGIRLEQEFGFVRIGLLYLISGYGGNLISALFLREGVSVGASGALFGLLGGMLSELIMNWSIYTYKVAALLILVIIIVANLGLGLLSQVDNFAHIGGFIFGFLLGFIFFIRPQFGWKSQRYSPPGPSPNPSKPKFKVYQYVLWVLSLLLLIAGLAIGTHMVLHGYNANKHCSWCRYLSCFPTHKRSCESHTCNYVQTGDQLTVSCSKNSTTKYIWTSPDPNTSQIQLQRLCNQLCHYH